MDNRPIGFFDSGLGGLTCIPKLMELLPEEKVIYFGDTARTPYGSKAVSTIKTFAMQIADFLVQNDVKMLVIACNTISATCIDDLREKYADIPVIGIINPATEKVSISCTEQNNVGIIGTKATIQSKAYDTSLESLNPNLKVFSKACPAFVPLIEEGIIDNEIMDLTIHYYMDEFLKENDVDTVVLGCTHYPLIKENIERLYPNVKIINPSEEIVSSIIDTLNKNDMLAEENDGQNIFYASDLSENFIKMIDRIFEDYNIQVKFKNLELL